MNSYCETLNIPSNINKFDMFIKENIDMNYYNNKGFDFLGHWVYRKLNNNKIQIFKKYPNLFLLSYIEIKCEEKENFIELNIKQKFIKQTYALIVIFSVILCFLFVLTLLVTKIELKVIFILFILVITILSFVVISKSLRLKDDFITIVKDKLF